MASTMAHQLVVLLLVLALPAAMSACASEVFPSGKTYVTCQDLPELGAALHWTYYAADASSGPPSLSLAFVAAPAAPGGWVAWGINPTATGNGNGMVGTQALLAFVAGGTSTPTVRTYNITSYYAVGAASTPIAFPAASGSLAADVGSGGRIRLYATLQLDDGMKVVDQVWQVGSSVTRGTPDVHAMAPENLAARGKLVLSVGAAAAASPPAHAGGPSSDRSSSWPPSGRQVSRTADTDSVSAMAHVVLALLCFCLSGRW